MAASAQLVLVRPVDSYLHNFDKLNDLSLATIALTLGKIGKKKSIVRILRHCSTICTTYSRTARLSLVQIEDYLLRRLSVRMCLVRPGTTARL